MSSGTTERVHSRPSRGRPTAPRARAAAAAAKGGCRGRPCCASAPLALLATSQVAAPSLLLVVAVIELGAAASSTSSSVSASSRRARRRAEHGADDCVSPFLRAAATIFHALHAHLCLRLVGLDDEVPRARMPIAHLADRDRTGGLAALSPCSGSWPFSGCCCRYCCCYCYCCLDPFERVPKCGSTHRCRRHRIRRLGRRSRYRSPRRCWAGSSRGRDPTI